MKFTSVYKGACNRPSALDLTFSPIRKKPDLVVFCHGYKGFKDWGPWNIVAKAFAEEGYDFLKFNFSHNGGTVEEPIDFPDVDAFAENTYTKELRDIECLLDRIEEGFNTEYGPVHYDRIHLIGHSRGGGVAILAAHKFSRINSLVTWAAVSDFGDRFNFDLEKWKADGVTKIKNSRTGQMLPHKYSFYQDFLDHSDDLDISKAAKQLDKPWMISHGQDDEAVCLSHADYLKNLNKSARLLILMDTGHTFGGSHPWDESILPDKLQSLVDANIEFLKTV